MTSLYGLLLGCVFNRSTTLKQEKKMNKTMCKVGLIVTVAAVFMMASTSVFASVVCSDMKIVKAGAKIIGGQKVNVVRVVIATGTCGNMTSTGARTFNFSSTNADAGLATALTALSLGQNVYLVLTDNNAANGTTVETIQVAAP